MRGETRVPVAGMNSNRAKRHRFRNFLKKDFSHSVKGSNLKLGRFWAGSLDADNIYWSLIDERMDCYIRFKEVCGRCII